MSQGKFTSDEAATILSALRLWQQTYCDPESGNIAVEDWPDHFESNAPLTSEQVDNLCEKINTGLNV